MDLINHYRRLFTYDNWANRRVAETINKIPQNTKVELLFSHVLNSQQVWHHRITSRSHDIDPWDILEPSEFGDIIDNVHKDWMKYFDSLRPKGLDAVISYENSAGDKFKNKLSDIMSHVMNHSTYHRAQISAIIKAAGYSPPVTDFIAFARINNRD
ncbi:MAG TPA: DinB family protein [Ignavibacteria bacterium]|nr:DinB family protein [Ignavibacteria bacterium]